MSFLKLILLAICLTSSVVHGMWPRKGGHWGRYSAPPHHQPPHRANVPAACLVADGCMVTDGVVVHSSSSTSTRAAPTPSGSGGVTKQGCVWVVPEGGSFTHYALYDFTNLNALPAGLSASTYKEKDTPYNIQYQASNVKVSGGYLNLVVLAGQTPKSTGKTVNCGEVSTDQDQIQYASVRTVAELSTVPGTCQAAFFYSSDSAEIDIEFLSDPNSGSNPQPPPSPPPPGSSPPLQYTNQPGTTPESYTTIPSPQNVNTTTHEYRIDWLPDVTKFYTDGVMNAQLTDFVSSDAGQWVWNNWSNGDKDWSVGPPVKGVGDSVMKIQRVEMYFNVSGDPGSCSM